MYSKNGSKNTCSVAFQKSTNISQWKLQQQQKKICRSYQFRLQWVCKLELADSGAKLGLTTIIIIVVINQSISIFFNKKAVVSIDKLQKVVGETIEWRDMIAR